MKDREHLLFSALLLAFGAYALRNQVVTHQREFLIFAAGYFFAVVWLSPDLDIHSKPLQRWGFLSLLWYPYTLLWKHRGRSHRPFAGFLERMAYLLIVLALFTWYLKYSLGVEVDPRALLGYVSTYWQEAVYFLGGAWAGSAVHIIEDRL